MSRRLLEQFNRSNHHHVSSRDRAALCLPGSLGIPVVAQTVDEKFAPKFAWNKPSSVWKRSCVLHPAKQSSCAWKRRPANLLDEYVIISLRMFFGTSTLLRCSICLGLCKVVVELRRIKGSIGDSISNDRLLRTFASDLWVAFAVITQYELSMPDSILLFFFQNVVSNLI